MGMWQGNVNLSLKSRKGNRLGLSFPEHNRNGALRQSPTRSWFVVIDQGPSRTTYTLLPFEQMLVLSKPVIIFTICINHYFFFRVF